MGKRSLALGLLALAVGCKGTLHKPVSTTTPISFKAFQALEKTLNLTPPPDNCGEQCQAYRQEFRYVVYVGQQIYCWWDLKKADTKTDFETLATALENDITDSTSPTAYYKILTRWAASLHDGHVNVWFDDASKYEIYSSPVRLEVFAPATNHERVLVTSADHGLGVDVGDEVLAINGVPSGQALDQAELSTSGSTKRMRRFFAAQSLVVALGADEGAQPLMLSLKNKGDIVIPRNVKIVAPKSAGGDAASDADAPQANDSIAAVKVLSGGIGYARITGFGGDHEEELFDQIMDRLAHTSGLILDMRANGGGDLSGDRFIGRFITQSVTRYKRRERWSDFVLALRPENLFLKRDPNAPFVEWHDLTVDPLSPRYDKPVVVLISPYCFSACDTFSAGLKANKLATFIGEPTGGGTGTPAGFDLPVSGMTFRYGVIQGETADGDPIEGVGTSPDIYVEPVIADRTGTQDSQLNRALQFLAGQNLQTSDLMGLKPVGTQSLDTTPTEERNLQLRRIQKSDEMASGIR